MIPLLPIKIYKGDCSSIIIKDTTDYSVGSGFYDFDAFKSGIRFIRITYPDGTYKYFCNRNINSPVDLLNQPNPDYIVVEQLDTEINDSNNTNANWSFNLESGNYTVDIISLPAFQGTCFGDTKVGVIVSPTFFIPLFNYVISQVACSWITGNIDNNFILTPFPGQATSDSYDLNEAYVNRVSFTIDCDLQDAIACVFSHYEESFCEDCKCSDVCKNPKSNNIMKTTLMLRELELIADDEYLYNKKLELYTPIIQKLCQCS